MDKRPDSALVNQVARAIPELFSAHGLNALVRLHCAGDLPHEGDLLVDLESEGVHVALEIDVRRRFDDRLPEQHVNTSSGSRLLLVPRLSRGAREKLRARQCNHADLSGSLFLRAPGIHIDVDGRGPRDVILVEKSKQQINPFSKKASLIARVLCEHYGEALSTADLVARTGLSRAWTFAVTQTLTERGYASSDEQGCRLSRPVELLRDWMVAYNWRRNPRRDYEIPFSEDQVAQRLSGAFDNEGIEWALTLLSAATRRIGYVEFQGPMHVYAIAPSSDLLQKALDRLYAVPVSAGGNLVLMSPPYYGNSVFVGKRRDQSGPLVSDVQLLLDLAHFPVRGPEAAEVLIRRRIAPAFDLSAADVSRLVEAVA
jgi:hypothetical protein